MPAWRFHLDWARLNAGGSLCTDFTAKIQCIQTVGDKNHAKKIKRNWTKVFKSPGTKYSGVTDAKRYKVDSESQAPYIYKLNVEMQNQWIYFHSQSIFAIHL